jgi:hypothetical protein
VPHAPTKPSSAVAGNVSKKPTRTGTTGFVMSSTVSPSL